MGKVLEQRKCINPHCESSDALTVYQGVDGTKNAFCWSCDTYFSEKKLSDALEMIADSTDQTNDHKKTVSSINHHNDNEEDRITSAPAITGSFVSSVEEASSHPIRELKVRGISYSTAEKYGVRVGVDVRDGVTPIYTLSPMYKNNNLSGYFQKVSNINQPNTYRSIGDCKQCDLFGLHSIPQKGKKLFITEGMEDCLSLYQVLKENSSVNWEPAVVALMGSKAKKGMILSSMDVLNNYEEVVLVLDSDTAGKEASTVIAKMLAGKVSIVTLSSEKDPNAMLMAGKGEELKWAALTGARKYQPDGILNAKDCWDRYKATDKVEYYPYPSYMPGLNKMMYGAKSGTVITIGAGTSIGKTALMRELKYHFLTTTNQKIADIELEADITETLKSIVGLKLRKRITLPDVEVDEELEQKAYEDLFSTGRYTLYDYFGGMDDDSLFSKLYYFAGDGHKFIFIDHLSIIVSEYAAEGGERERIDTIMTKLAKLAKETNIIIFLVVHLKKSESSRVSFEKGAIPDLDDLRGSAMIKNLSWDVIFLSRNTQHEDPECAKITEITSAKCRLTGRTGCAGFIKFDETTGRMVETVAPPNYKLGSKR